MKQILGHAFIGSALFLLLLICRLRLLGICITLISFLIWREHLLTSSSSLVQLLLTPGILLLIHLLSDLQRINALAFAAILALRHPFTTIIDRSLLASNISRRRWSIPTIFLRHIFLALFIQYQSLSTLIYALVQHRCIYICFCNFFSFIAHFDEAIY